MGRTWRLKKWRTRTDSRVFHMMTSYSSPFGSFFQPFFLFQLHKRKKEKTRFGFFSCYFLLPNWMIHIRVFGLKGKKRHGSAKLVPCDSSSRVCLLKAPTSLSCFYLKYRDDYDNYIWLRCKVVNAYASSNNESEMGCRPGVEPTAATVTTDKRARIITPTEVTAKVVLARNPGD